MTIVQIKPCAGEELKKRSRPTNLNPTQTIWTNERIQRAWRRIEPFMNNLLAHSGTKRYSIEAANWIIGTSLNWQQEQGGFGRPLCDRCAFHPVAYPLHRELVPVLTSFATVSRSQPSSTDQFDQSVMVTMRSILGRWVTPDHAFMGCLMNVNTNMHGACRDHSQWNRVDRLQYDGKMRANHFARSQDLSVMVRH